MSDPLTTTSATKLHDEPGVRPATIIIAVVFGLLLIGLCIGFLVFAYFKIRKQPEKKDPESADAGNNEAPKADEAAPVPEPQPAVRQENHPSTFCEGSGVGSQAVLPSKEQVSVSNVSNVTNN
uniref:Uncharacterized protein n=1 Tax=Panagrellus redivivus TaxID=6233 RepID=A0A7E4UN66_PANRE